MGLLLWTRAGCWRVVVEFLSYLYTDDRPISCGQSSQTGVHLPAGGPIGILIVNRLISEYVQCWMTGEACMSPSEKYYIRYVLQMAYCTHRPSTGCLKNWRFVEHG